MPRPQLEAEAYSLWMAGSVLLEKESDWEGALARFLRARCGARWVAGPGLVGCPGSGMPHAHGHRIRAPSVCPSADHTVHRLPACRQLFEELAKVGSFEQQGVCKHFLDQVDPTVRWGSGPGWQPEGRGGRCRWQQGGGQRAC